MAKDLPLGDKNKNHAADDLFLSSNQWVLSHSPQGRAGVLW
jgi:hypothetical protein